MATTARLDFWTRLLHWVVAALMLFLVALGAWMVELSYFDRWQPGALRWHRNLGLVVFALAAIHLSRRLFRPPPPPVAGLREWEKSAAQTAHAALWFLMFALPTSGYFISTSAGAGIDFFGGLTIPALFAIDSTTREWAIFFHYWLAYGLCALVLLHAAAALKHHFVDKNEVLARMSFFV